MAKHLLQPSLQTEDHWNNIFHHLLPLHACEEPVLGGVQRSYLLCCPCTGVVRRQQFLCVVGYLVAAPNANFFAAQDSKRVTQQTCCGGPTTYESPTLLPFR
jgi:hypothetical protein